MSLTVVNSSQLFTAGSGTSTNSAAFSLTAGNSVLVGVRLGIDQTTILSMTDTAGNVYREVTGTVTGASGLAVWYASNVTGNASNTVTATHNASANCSIVTVQVSGTIDYPVDTWAVSAITTGTTPTTASFTTAFADEVIVVFGDQDTTGHAWSAASGYTLQTQDSQNVLAVATKIVSSIQTGVTASIVSADATAAKIAVAVTLTSDVTVLTPYGPGMVVVPDADTNSGLFGITFNSNTSTTVNNRIPLGAYSGRGAGEGGAQLPGGTFIVGSKGSSSDTIQAYQIYSAALAQTALITSVTGAGAFDPIASDYVSQFWVGHSAAGTVTVRPISASGSVGSSQTLTDVSNLRCMGVSQDNTTLYYADTTTGHPIRRWDLVNDAALGVFVTPSGTNVWGEDLLVIPDTASFVVLVQTNSAVESFTLNRYSTVDGSLISSWPVTGAIDNYSDPRLSIDAGGPSQAIWIRTYPDETGATTTFLQMQLSDGSLLTSFTVPMTLDSTNPNDAPLSCPFFAWSDNIHLYNYVGEATTLPLVRVRQVGLPAITGNVTQFIGRAEVQMQPGLCTVDDPSATPVITMAWSGDNGLTFKPEKQLSLGREGNYYARAYQHVVGSMRQPVVKVACSDNVNFTLTDLFITREEGMG